MHTYTTCYMLSIHVLVHRCSMLVASMYRSREVVYGGAIGNRHLNIFGQTTC